MSVKVNGQNVKFLAIGSAVLYADDEIISGCDTKGDRWYQLTLEPELDEPSYFKDDTIESCPYGYYVTKKEYEQSGNSAGLDLYKMFYRCLKNSYSTPQRIIFKNGKINRTQYIQPSSSASMLRFPLWHIDEMDGKYIQYVAKRVCFDHHFIANPFNGYTTYEFAITIPLTEEESNRRQDVMQNTIGIMDAKIYEIYGFTPDNKPQEVDDKVKVAKVINDWLQRNNVYYLEDWDWEDQTPYSALSQGEFTPVCASYNQAVHLMLERYGINSITVQGYLAVGGKFVGHEWVMVNYHDEIGVYPNDENVWCIIDATGTENPEVTGWNWVAFNLAHSLLSVENFVVRDPYKPYGVYPVMYAQDSEHRYDLPREEWKAYEW